MRLLWDLDGTIVDTYPLMVKSFIKVYEKVHESTIDSETVLPLLKTTTEEAFRHFDIPISYEDEYKEINRNMANQGSAIFAGVEKVLAAAKLNVIVTHRNHDSTEQLLEKWGLLKYFKEIISPREDGFPRKPEPDAYRYLYDKYKLDWALGDRALDLIPARLVGMKTVAFQNKAIEADIHIDAYTLDLIEKLKH